MMVTDEMVDAARAIMDKTYADQDMKVRCVIEVALQAAWVSAKDRMPDEYNDVIIKDDQGEYKISYRKRNNWVVDVGHYDVTHWMPLPEFNGE
jgi:hypothetical protein